MSRAIAPLPSSPLPTQYVRTLQGGHQAPVQVAKFTEDGRYAFTGGQDRVICLWNPWREQQPQQQQVTTSSSSSTSSTSSTSTKDGKIGSSSSSPSSSSSAGGGASLLKQYRGHGYEVLDICVQGGGCSTSTANTFASVGGDRFAILWDIASGRTIRKLHGHSRRLTCCTMLYPDSSVLLTGSEDMTINCWDLRSHHGHQQKQQQQQPQQPQQQTFSIQTLTGFRDTVTRIKVLPNGNEIVASSLDGTIRTFDLRNGKCIVDSLSGSSGSSSGSSSGTSTSLSISSSSSSSFSSSPVVPISTMAVSNDSQCLLLAVPEEEGALLLVEKATSTVLAHYKGHMNTLYRLQPTFTHDDAFVLCGSEDGHVLMWDLVEGKIVKRIEAAHKRVVSWVDYYSSSHIPGAMLTASFDGTAKLWVNPDEYE